jgi:hypothetical protein
MTLRETLILPSWIDEAVAEIGAWIAEIAGARPA